MTLMRAIAAGDERALTELAHRRLGPVLRFAERMLGASAEADDVAQEALMRIWRNAGRWRPERARLNTWIYTIVYRLCLDRLRRARTAPLEAAMEVADPARSALDGLAGEEDLVRLRRALHGLPSQQRAAITLFYYEELPGPQAAEVLGLSLRAYWSLLHRARQTLQARLRAASTPSESRTS